MSTSDLRITSAFKPSRNRRDLFVQEGSTVTADDGLSGFGTLNGSKLVPPTTGDEGLPFPGHVESLGARPEGVTRVTGGVTNLSTRTVQDRTDCRQRFLVEQRKQLGESPLRMEENRATEASRFDPCRGDDARRRPVAA